MVERYIFVGKDEVLLCMHWQLSRLEMQAKKTRLQQHSFGILDSNQCSEY